MTQRLLRYLVGLTGLAFIAIGLTLFLTPGRQATLFAVAPSGSAGLSTVRADLAGLFLGMGGFAVAGALSASVHALLVTVILLALIAFGRVANLVLDGPSPEALRSLAVELVAIALLVACISSLRTARPLRLRVALAAMLALTIGLGVAYVFQRQIGLALVRRYLVSELRSPLTESLPDGLHVGLCGSGSPLPDATRSGPCVVVIAGQHIYVVDAGDGSPRTLGLMGVPAGQVESVFLTHFHSDHIGGLGELLLQRWAGGSRAEPMPVHGPQGVERVVDGFNLAYSLDKGYRVAHHGPEVVPPAGSGGVARAFTIVEGSDTGQVVLQEDGVIVTAFPVQHSPVFPAVGYRIEYAGRSVFVSGDTAASPSVAQAAAGADLLLHEGLQTVLVSELQQAAALAGRTTLARIAADIPSYHTTPEDAARIAAQAGVKQLVLYHTIPPLPVAYLNAAFLGDAHRWFRGPITVSTDGLLVTLTSGTTTITQRNVL